MQLPTPTHSPSTPHFFNRALPSSESKTSFARLIQHEPRPTAFAAFIREESARAKYYREESQRLASKARNAEGRISYLKHKYLGILQEHGIEKIKGNAYSVSIRHTPSAFVEDDANLDDLYVRVIPAKREPDKRIILEALKGGVEIPGCRLVQCGRYGSLYRVCSGVCQEERLRENDFHCLF